MVPMGEYILENVVTQVLVVHLYDYHLLEEMIYFYHWTLQNAIWESADDEHNGVKKVWLGASYK